MLMQPLLARMHNIYNSCLCGFALLPWSWKVGRGDLPPWILEFDIFLLNFCQKVVFPVSSG